MNTAKAIIAVGNNNFVVDEIIINDPIGNEVLVDIRSSGICHTDYDHMTNGSPTPYLMGHEGAGIVTKVGPNVSRIEVGDKVLLNWAIPCGECFQCDLGNQVMCVGDKPKAASLESTHWKGKPISRSFNLGTMATKTLVRENALVKTESEIPFNSACIIGCGVMTGYGSAVNVAKIEPGSSVAVIGCGGVGLNVIQGAKIAGATKIIAMDISEKRLEMAVEFGATHTYQTKRDDNGLLNAAEDIKEMTKGYGADYAFECTAIPALGAAPLAMIRNAGTAVQVSGIEEEITIDMNLFEWDKTYINPLYGKARPQIDFPKIVEHYDCGNLKLDEMISKVYKMEELDQAFLDMLAGRIAKGVIEMNT